jgi:alcohol dehydrogenase class IV
LLASGLATNAEALKRSSGDVSRILEVENWLASVLGSPKADGLSALRQFVDENGLPSLQDLGLPGADIEEVARAAAHASSTKANPIALSHDDICSLLRNA